MKKSIFTVIVGIAFLLLSGLTAAPPVSAQLKPILPDLTGIVKDKNWALVLGKALFHDQQAGSNSQSCFSCHFVAGADTRLKNQLSPGFNDVTFAPDGDASFGSIRSDTGECLPGYLPSGAVADSTYALTAADFPLNRLEDELNRDSRVVTTTNDRVSSSGSYDSDYTRVFRMFWLKDICEEPSNAIFHAGKYAGRQVEPRNTPTTINSVLNHRNFWDGRANSMFNGVGPFGMRDILGDPKNRLIVLNNGKPELGFLQLENASTASQAVGPPLSAKEMSCDGRKFADVGRKLLLRQPLEVQKVAATDSILGKYRNTKGLGLGLGPKYTYAALIKKAFDPKYWNAPGKYTMDSTGKLKSDRKNGYTQMETNFSMFWGIAIMLYESTLISDQSEFDILVANGDLVIGDPTRLLGDGCTAPNNNVDPLLLRGCNLFASFNPNIAGLLGLPFPSDLLKVTRPDGTLANGGSCFICHTMGPNLPNGQPNNTFTEVAQTVNVPFAPTAIVFPNADGGLDARDFGFANLGIRPVVEDPGIGGTDPYGNPLSYLRQIKDGNILDSWLTPDVINSITETPVIGAPFIPGPSGTKLENDGAMKVPTVRNIALTPPYFMAGHYADLRQMLAVYNRGGNRRQINPANPNYAIEAHGSNCVTGDTSGTGPDGIGILDWPVSNVDCNTNAAFNMVPLEWTDCEHSSTPCDVATDDISAVIRFLKSLTDPRVQCDQAPFDHPSLLVFDGHRPTDFNRDGKGDDILFNLPAVGAEGYAPNSGYCIPNSGDLFAPGMQARSGGVRVPLNE